MFDGYIQAVGMMGMWGMIINGIQASGLEHKSWKMSNWDGGISMWKISSLLG